MPVLVSSCQVFVKPADPDAGAPVRIKAEVAAAPADNLDGRSLEIRDHNGKGVATLPLAASGGAVRSTPSVVVNAPDEPGEYEWSAHLAPAGKEAGEARPDPLARFTIVAVPHRTRLSVWDVPPAIECGSTFAARVGIKCSSGCDMTGRTFEVVDHDETTVATGVLNGEIGPGTEGLFVAEVKLPAPKAAGLHRWQVRVPEHVAGYPHEAASTHFGVHAVLPAAFTVMVEAVDSKQAKPLPNMSVTMHPYRATTDASGHAELKVAPGSYTIYVSGPGYYPVQRKMDVEADITTRAPLEAEPPPSKVI